MDYGQNTIRRFHHWTLFLHPSQYYLGRVYAWAHRDGALDIKDATLEELTELAGITRSVSIAWDRLWKPDKMNFASLGNIEPHLHVHLVPRYKQPRVFQDIEFIDEQWGSNYSPYNREFRIPEQVHLAIRDAMRENI